MTFYNEPSPSDPVDIYRIPYVGIRTIRLTNTQFLVNERPFYFHGANAHEDSDIRGKGFDRVLFVKYFNLYGWLHSNAFRTSHYQYAEEFYQLADRYGIATIDETTAVGLTKASYFSQATQNHHKEVLTEMITRDRNHPSILMWSLANEPAVGLDEAAVYFSPLVNFTRPLAGGRPITFVTYHRPNADKSVPFFDVICINRYFGFSDNSGYWVDAANEVNKDLDGWRSFYPTKPILFSEYGAETIAALHSDPPLMFTEEFQKEFYTTYHGISDHISSILHPNTGYLIGELP